MNTSIIQLSVRKLGAVLLAASLMVVTNYAQAAVAAAPAKPAVEKDCKECTCAAMPSAADLQRVVDEAYAKYKDDNSGKNAD